jgi:hypothetical protein
MLLQIITGQPIFWQKAVDAEEIFIKTYEGMMAPEPWKN